MKTTQLNNYIKTFLVLLGFLICLGVSAQENKQKGIDIYILMGQSNMAGRGRITAQYTNQEHPRVLMLNEGNQWVTARHPLHFDKPKAVGVGPGLAFGIDMARQDSSTIIGLVPCAVGGTPIRQWSPGAYDDVTSGYPYDDAVKRIKQAMKRGTVKGILWHQGEGDAGVKSSKTYIDSLSVLIARIREVTEDPDLPFVVGQLARYRDNYQYINDELVKLPAQVPNTTVVSSEGLWHKGDGTHFDSPSASEFGRRFAKGMRKLQGKGTVKPPNLMAGSINTLSPAERAEGWELLFDGQDPNIRWRSVKDDMFPKAGWIIEEDALVLQPGRKGGDIITREQFSDFELTLEYKLADSANTGIKYFVSPLKNAKGRIELNGPEFQLIDDYKHASVADGKSPETSTASLYLLHAPEGKVLNGPGSWNKVRIVARGKNVEHWVNGKKVLSYTRGSEAFRQLVAETKFKEYESYGETEAGHILLQDHKDKASFRNIKIRRLD